MAAIWSRWHDTQQFTARVANTLDLNIDQKKEIILNAQIQRDNFIATLFDATPRRHCCNRSIDDKTLNDLSRYATKAHLTMHDTKSVY